MVYFLALSRKNNIIQQSLKILLILRAMKPLIKATAVKGRKLLLCFGNHCNRNLIISLIFHDMMMKNKNPPAERVVLG